MHDEQLPLAKHVVRTGHSMAVVIPAKFVQKTGIQAGDPVEVNVNYEEGKITYKFVTIRQLNLV